MAAPDLDPSIFRSYDIRGVAGDNLTDDVAFWVGRACGAACIEAGVSAAAVGGDGRASTPGLTRALTDGLLAAGVDVLDVGMVPTPVLYYAATKHTEGTGIMITGSHNPPEYNGIKMMVAGKTLAEGDIQALKSWIVDEAPRDASRAEAVRTGTVRSKAVLREYIDAVADDIERPNRPLKVVIDSGNGVGGLIARPLFEAIGCEVISLFDEVDATFPNHHPDPAEPENLVALQRAVVAEAADLGIAFDGDADRLGVVTNSGRIVWPDQYLMHFAESVLPDFPGGKIVFDVKCSADVRRVIERAGGCPIMWRTGHSHTKNKLKEIDGVIAGEFSGHICFGDRWNGMDDAPYAGARFIETLAEESVDAVLEKYPDNVSTPELKIATTDERKFEVVDAFKDKVSFEGGVLTDIDGIRIDFEDGWGLLRASNTSPVLSLRFEARSADALRRIRQQFSDALSSIDPSLSIA